MPVELTNWRLAQVSRVPHEPMQADATGSLPPLPTTSADTNGGTWTRTGSSVSFRSSIDNTTSYTGTYNKGTLTLNDMGIVLVFVR